MIDFDKEIKKFHPSPEIEEAEDIIYNNNVTDMTDVMMEMMKNNNNSGMDDPISIKRFTTR